MNDTGWVIAKKNADAQFEKLRRRLGRHRNAPVETHVAYTWRLVLVGALLCERRKERLLTQAEIAEALDIDASAYTRLELGTREASIVRLFEACEALDVSYSLFASWLEALTLDCRSRGILVLQRQRPNPEIPNLPPQAHRGEILSLAQKYVTSI